MLRFFERAWRGLLALSQFKIALLLFSVAFLLRLAIVFLHKSGDQRSHYELERVALSLAQTGVYGNPYRIPTGPTAHVAPGYTLILAAIFKIFGTGATGELCKQILACGITALSCALVPSVARGLRLDVRAGILAGFIGALSPVQIDGDWESPYTKLALMLVSVLTVQLWNKKLTLRTAAVHGICWGVTLLFAPALLSGLAILIVAGLQFYWDHQLRRYLIFATLEVLVATACLTPWMVRNYRALGTPIATRSNFGLELRVSNNDVAGADQRAALANGAFAKLHPLLNAYEAMKVRELGEVAYNKQEMSLALYWIRSHPKHFIRLTSTRVRYFWFYSYIPRSGARLPVFVLEATRTLLGWMITIVGILGLAKVFRREKATGITLALLLLVYSLPYYFVHFTPRYEYPIQWILTLMAMTLVVKLWPQRYPIAEDHVVEREVRDLSLTWLRQGARARVSGT